MKLLAAAVAMAFTGLMAAGCGNPASVLIPECSVGIAATDLQVTAKGVHAQDFCDTFIRNSNGSGYTIDQVDNTGTLMCRVTIRDSTTVTVRDKGLLKLQGYSECSHLQQMQ